jgi:HSF-type DNA-binding
VEQQKDKKNEQYNKMISSGFYESHSIVNNINAINLTRRFMKSWSQELEGLATTKMIYDLDSSQSLGINDLMATSNQSHLRLAWPCHHSIILQHSHANRASTRAMPLSRKQAFPIELERSLPSINLTRGVMERQKSLCNFFALRHSPVLPNARQPARDINNRKDCVLSGAFPAKLHRLLLDLDQDRVGVNTAHFVPNGTAFVILDSLRFEAEVMKEYFPRMSSYSSFQRQLNLYDFSRIHYGSSDKTYYHPSFLRDFPSLCIGMKRRKVKQNIRKSKC